MVRARIVGGAELFNLPLSEPHTVMHVSGTDDFENMHLVSAMHFSEDNPTADQLSAAIESIGLDFCPEVFDTFVVSGDNTEKVVAMLENLSMEASNGTLDAGPFCKRLMSRCKTIAVVPSSTLPTVAAEFPFLVETGPARFELPPILPAMISKNLFLGSQTHASSAEVFEKLGISAVANISDEVPNFFEKTSDFVYLRCAVEDTDSQDMSEAFESSFKFIHAHITSNRKVLVHCSRGVSRSVSVVINYLLQAQDTFRDFPSALEHVQACRKGARPNRGFTHQLLLRFPTDGEGGT